METSIIKLKQAHMRAIGHYKTNTHTHAKKHHQSKTHIQACTGAWQKYNKHTRVQTPTIKLKHSHTAASEKSQN